MSEKHIIFNLGLYLLVSPYLLLLWSIEPHFIQLINNIIPSVETVGRVFVIYWMVATLFGIACLIIDKMGMEQLEGEKK